MSTRDVFNCLFPLDVQNEIPSAIKSLMLFMASLFIGFLDERCVASKAGEERPGDEVSLRRIKEDSKFSRSSSVTHLIAFRGCISYSKPK